MTQLTPLEFSLSVPCFACGVPAGEQCWAQTWSTGDKYQTGRRMYPHFGRVGMPASRGWMFVATKEAQQ